MYAYLKKSKKIPLKRENHSYSLVNFVNSDGFYYQILV